MAKREREKALERKRLRKAGDTQASLNGLTMSARKVRVVADLIRGQSVESALKTLAFQRKACAAPLRKLLDAAIANANERGSDVDSLIISKLQVHKGALRKRFMPRAQGRATTIRKQTAHVEVCLGEV